MNSKEFIKAVDLIEKEKKIDRELIFEAMELALATAYKKNFDSLTNSKIFIDRNTGDIKVYSYLNVGCVSLDLSFDNTFVKAYRDIITSPLDCLILDPFKSMKFSFLFTNSLSSAFASSV